MSEFYAIKERLLQSIAELKQRLDVKQVKRYNLDLTEKIIGRLASFAGECEKCRKSLCELEAAVSMLSRSPDKPGKADTAEYFKQIQTVTNHLQQQHKLVTDGYYTSVYMSFGVAIGLALGVAFSQAIKNTAFIGIGLPIGIAIGMAIGTSMDAQAKKNGLVI